MFSPTPWFGVEGPLRGRGGAQDASKKYARAAGALQGHRINWKGLRGQGLGGGQLGHPAQIHTHHLLRHSALGLRLPARALRLCVGVTRLRRILTTRPRRLHEGDALVLRAIEILAPRLGPSRTRRRDCSRQGPLCSASDSSTPHTACTVHPLRSRHASGRTCAGRPAADSAGPATAARPGRTAGTHAPHKGVPGKSASATRTFAGSPVSCCTAFQRRSVTRLQRQQARLNRKAGPAPEHGKHAEDARDGSI